MEFQGVARLIDFGSTKLFEENAVFQGTISYQAPELKNISLIYNKASDIWALGVFFYTISTGQKGPLDFEIPETLEEQLEKSLKGTDRTNA